MKTKTLKSHTIRIDHPQASYGIFSFNESGDLFLMSDWGNYCYSWRAFGEDFYEFLSTLQADYLLGKFETSHRQNYQKEIQPKTKVMVTFLIQAFLVEITNFLQRKEKQDALALTENDFDEIGQQLTNKVFDLRQELFRNELGDIQRSQLVTQKEHTKIIIDKILNLQF